MRRTSITTCSQSKPRLCFVGPMIGRNPGYVTTQGERLADLLAKEGYPVIAVSALTNRYLRVADIAQTLVRRRHDFDIAVLQVFSGPSFVVEDFASRLIAHLGRRLIMVLRGGGMPVFMSDRPSWTRRVLDRADQLVAPSPFLARAIRPLGYQAKVIPNVIDLSAYSYKPRDRIAPRLFWMRCFHDIYNPSLAVRVLARVKREFPAASLVMAGPDRGLRSSMRRLASDLGVQGAVQFVGFLDMGSKIREFSHADIYLNTNRVDNMPVSVVEACACGVPVVATRVGGVSDLLVDGDTALLVRDDDERSMAEAVVRLLRNPELVHRVSRNGRRLAEGCSAMSVMPQWHRLIERVLNVRRSTSV